jgi:phosphomannomutase/phosphoglucomutase
VVSIDGLRVEYADGFGLVRASNTTPVLVLRFDLCRCRSSETLILPVIPESRSDIRDPVSLPFNSL